MSSVKKSQRKDYSKKPFALEFHLNKVRGDLTILVFMDFGIDREKYEAKRENYRKSTMSSPNQEYLLFNYECRWDSFKTKFLDSEEIWMLDTLRQLSTDFQMANSIYPGGTPYLNDDEYYERRRLMTHAIGLAYAIKCEINFLVKALPVDAKKYVTYLKDIKKLIRMLKGVRRADNRFHKPDSVVTDVPEEPTTQAGKDLTDLVDQLPKTEDRPLFGEELDVKSLPDYAQVNRAETAYKAELLNDLQSSLPEYDPKNPIGVEERKAMEIPEYPMYITT